jgi:hypothetical protein
LYRGWGKGAVMKGAGRDRREIFFSFLLLLFTVFLEKKKKDKGCCLSLCCSLS